MLVFLLIADCSLTLGANIEVFSGLLVNTKSHWWPIFFVCEINGTMERNLEEFTLQYPMKPATRRRSKCVGPTRVRNSWVS